MADYDRDRVKEDIRNALDIADVVSSYIQIKRNGPNAIALCPFHKEKTPSFHVNALRQTYHCFGCGAGGDVFDFVMRQEGVDFPTALRLLGQRAGIAVPDFFERRDGAPASSAAAKDRIFAANEAAAKLYLRELTESAAAAHARDYLAGRSLGPGTWAPYGIGYAPDAWGFLSDRARGPNAPFSPETLEAAGLALRREGSSSRYDRFRDRVVFAIRDELGRVVGFSGRTLKTDGSDGGKYVNTNETPAFRKSRILYGMDRARKAIHDSARAILCEGQIDCIRCHIAGFRNVVASQGTAFTPEHARLLKRYASSVLIVLDADAAGEKAALRTAELLLAEEMDVSVAALPPGEDPDSLILGKGPAAFQAVLDGAMPVAAFLLRLLRRDEALDTDAGIRRAADRLLTLAAASPSAVQREQMTRAAALGLGIGFDSLQADLRKKLSKKIRFSRTSDDPGGAPESLSASLSRPAPGPAGAIPPEDRALAELLCNAPPLFAPQLAALVRTYLRYPMLHPCVQPVVAALAEEESDLLSALEDAPAASKAFLAEISNSPQKILVPDDERAERLAEAVCDCLRRIWRRHLLSLRDAAARRRLAAATPEDRTAALREQQTLQMDLAKIRGPWPETAAVFRTYLERES